MDPHVCDSTPFDLSGVTLDQWQIEACDAWERGDSIGRYRGTLEIFTGGGKSLIALECIRRAAVHQPQLRVAVVVPTTALAGQWRRVLRSHTRLADAEIGELHGDRKDELNDHRAVIAVINTAARRLPDMSLRLREPLMLVVDESHRAGAPTMSGVLDTLADFRLGLSATAEREDVDDDGLPIDYDDHVLGRKLGGIVYRFDLRAARAIGWLPNFTVHHHAVELSPHETERYEQLSRKVDDAADRLQELGMDLSAVRSVAQRDGDAGVAARAYIGAVSLRKDLLYRASERARVTVAIIKSVAAGRLTSRVLLFHERIDEAMALYGHLVDADLPVPVGVEHSRLPEVQRQLALSEFAAGTVPVLVSVKSLVEGIDVPAADVGISVASSSSVRQRVQALGRVLRRRFDGARKTAQMPVDSLREGAVITRP
jgi:superfamily II DNA or RNA helicase